jgi:hypothetical protein
MRFILMRRIVQIGSQSLHLFVGISLLEAFGVGKLLVGCLIGGPASRPTVIGEGWLLTN